MSCWCELVPACATTKFFILSIIRPVVSIFFECVHYVRVMYVHNIFYILLRDDEKEGMSKCKSWRVITRLLFSTFLSSFFLITDVILHVSMLCIFQVCTCWMERSEISIDCVDCVTEWKKEQVRDREGKKKWMSQWQSLGKGDKWDDCANWERKDCTCQETARVVQVYGPN